MNILTFFRDRSHQRALKLYDEARELVDNGIYEEALKIGRKLRKLRYSGAFEIEGLAYSGLDRNEDAVRVLREGLAIEPSVWLNWLLLGSCLSNLGKFEEALLAYDRAQACPYADRSVIELNRAIVASRRQDYATALRHLDNIGGHESAGMRLTAIECRVTALHALGRDAESEDLGARTLNEWRDSNSDDGQRWVGEIAFVVGDIRRVRGEDRDRLLGDAIAWWRATHHDTLLWLIRELQGRRSPDSQYFRLMLHGRFSSEDAARGFFTTADVVADSVEEALALLLEIDPFETDAEVTIKEATAVEPRPNDTKGVYWQAGRVYYKKE